MIHFKSLTFEIQVLLVSLDWTHKSHGVSLFLGWTNVTVRIWFPVQIVFLFSQNQLVLVLHQNHWKMCIVTCMYEILTKEKEEISSL